ncbi:MAG TPA: cation diffusion facilitator family transporter [Gammaproteobacteria bacterium]|nr:cation diffusion facilitator family transporter [Gammaproteobacteria bacterium]
MSDGGAAEASAPAAGPGAEQKRLMRAASLASVGVALSLSALKLWAWGRTDSIAMLGSLADSFLDLVASVITLFAIRVAVTPPDREHRFGHGKSEGVASLLQAAIVSVSALSVAARAVERLLEPRPVEHAGIGAAVMVASLALTLGLVAFQRYVVARTRSLAIVADSLHYRADILTNVAVLLAIYLSYAFSWYAADPLLGLLVVAVIITSVRAIATEAMDVLLDRELPQRARKRIEDIASAHPEVRGVHDVRTRSAGHTQFIQLHIELDPDMRLVEAHEISDAVELEVQKAFPLAEVLIHTDPYGLQETKDPF